MKSLYLSLILFISGYTLVSAQNAADYSFSVKSGISMEDISSGSTLIFANGQDDVSSAAIDLPFTFTFAGTAYTQFSVSTNGLIGFGSTPVTDIGEDNILNESATFPILAPWWEDLYTAANGSIIYKTIGATGHRILIVEWKVRKFKASSALLYNKTFQAWLFEGTNKVQFVYGTGVVDIFTSASVGIAASAGDYLSVNPADNTASSTSSDNTGTWPGDGASYIFSTSVEAEPITIAGDGSVNGVGCNGANNGSIILGTISGGDGNYTISWTGPSSYTASENSINGLAPGTYHYNVTDASETAPVSGDIIISEPEPLYGEISLVNGTCSGTDDGQVSVSSISGGHGTYEYSLSYGTWQSSNTFTGLANSTYNLQMRDAANVDCVRDLGNFDITTSGVAPTVHISAGVPGFCANLTLNAIAEDANSYMWSNGWNASYLSLGAGDTDGDYTVTVTNTNGCTASATYNFAKQNVVNSYTVLGLKSVTLGRNNTVGGAVGNTSTIAGQDIWIGRNSAIYGFVKASEITLGDPVSVYGDVVYAPVNVALPAMLLNTSTTGTLTDLTIPADYNGPAITGNFKQLTIGKKSNVTLTGTVYGKIIIEEAADVTFTAGDISIGTIETADGKNNGDYTTITFQHNTNVRIKNRVTLGNKNRVYGELSTLYVGDTTAGAEKVTVGGKNTIVSMNIYMPHGLLLIDSGNVTSNCTMNGMFIAERINSDKYVNWYGYICDHVEQGSSAVGRARSSVAETETAVTSVESTEVATPASRELRAGVYPNPSMGRFTLQLNNTKSTKAEIRIINQNGAEVMHQNARSIEPFQTFQFDLSKQASGMYMVKVITNEGIQIFKMIVKK